MYYCTMKTGLEIDFKSKNFFSRKSYSGLLDKENSFFHFKFYQKLLVLVISFSTILIFSESPRELENICENYYSKNLCIIW